jgi:hypothetical protein
MPEANGIKMLRIVVFVVGLGEFLTSILLLFLPGLYKSVFGLSPSFDSYYIQQIGMFQFLVGSAILVGSRQAENPVVSRFAVYFNIVSLVFWVYYILSQPGPSGLFRTVVIGFIGYHTVMTAILVAVARRARVPVF